MTKILPFFIVLILLAGCKKELVKEPNRLIEREKMVDIMYDLALLEGMKLQNPMKLDSFKNNSNQYIYKKYKIDSVQFAQSNIYYAADYQEYEKMYNQVKSRIEENKLQITSIIKAKSIRDSINAIAKKKIELKQKVDSIKKIQDSIQKASKN